MNQYEKAGTQSAAFDFNGFHSGINCIVSVIMGASGLMVLCTACRVVVSLEAVSVKIEIQGSKKPLQEVTDDPSNPRPSG